jgi:hypothetical protein
MTKQIETATVVGTVTGAGDASVIVTSAYMANSPKTFLVAMSGSETADQAAALMRAALVYDADIAAQFIVSGATDKVILTTHVDRANDTTLNIAIANGTCTGLTAAPTSANTQAGAGISNGYATLAEYKSWIAVRGMAGAVGTDVNDDAAIEILIEGASRYIDRETGQRFYADTSDATRYYTANDGGTYVYIDALSVAPTSVSCDFSRLRSYEALASVEYDLLPDNALLDGYPYNKIELVASVATRLFPTQRRGVRVVGKFGYPTVPGDIKEACLSIVQNTYAARSGQTSGGSITVTAAGVVIRPQEVPAMAQKTIEHYRDIT